MYHVITPQVHEAFLRAIFFLPPKGGLDLVELELELIQTQMAQKPMLRAEVYAHAMRASQNRKKEVRPLTFSN